MAEEDEVLLKKDVILRNYQLSLIKKCLTCNTIIFLPTGAGKTEIAIQIIKSYGEAITGDLIDGAKRILFMTPTKELTRQQTKVIGEKTPFKVCKYTGEDGVDFWPKSKWLEELNKQQVLVMTPAVMDNILIAGITTLAIFALIVIDECHNGVDDHAIRQVMKNLKNIPDQSQQPRILGLTATLLNRDFKTSSEEILKLELKSLETTFQSKIATCDELGAVLKYSAQPNVTLIPIPENQHGSLNFEKTTAYWKKNLSDLDKIDKDMRKLKTGFITEQKLTYEKRANRIFEDIIEALQDLGVYGASLTAQYHFLQLLQKEYRCDDEDSRNRISFITCGVHLMRSELLRHMNDDDSSANILKYSSSKVLEFLELFKNNDDDLTIVFTKRRSTAIVLTHILRLLSADQNVRFQHVKPISCIGGNTNPNLLAESLLHSKWQQETLKQFSSKIKNTLIATSVLEEGIDLPDCNRVIRFDHDPYTYRSFIQSKGRCRSKNGVFYSLVPDGKYIEFKRKVELHLSTEKALYKILSEGYDERSIPTLSDVQKNLYNEMLPPFYPNGPTGAHATGISAIPCVIKYCTKLPQDAFAGLTPIHFTKPVGDKKVVGYVSLPVVSPLRHLIVGQPMLTKKMAKRSVFLETVKQLYEAGELTNELQPKVFKADCVECEWLFPNYKNESFDNPKIIVGTKNRRQIYDIQYPACLSGCAPVPDEPCYLHIMVLTPQFQEEPTSNRNRVFKQLLLSHFSYAILSTKKLTPICDFPLYLRLGEVNCHLELNNIVTVPKEDLKHIASFHLNLFSYVIPCAKEFMMMNSNVNDFFVVPVNKVGNRYNISWNIVKNIDHLCSKVPADPGHAINKEMYANTIVAPTYRASEPELYIVTDVCENITPCSTFPGPSDTTYISYYKDKYNEIIHDTSQPLLEVKRLPVLKSNFILPRKMSPSGIKSRRKMIADGDDFEEILVAELCDRYQYPADLWLKGMFLPTIIHRVSQLLPLVELSKVLTAELNLIPKSTNWAPLSPDLPITLPQTESENKITSNLRLIDLSSSKDINKNRQLPAAALWSDKNEPVNIFAQMEKVADCDLKYYDEYLKESSSSIESVKRGDAILNYGDFQTPAPTPILPLFIFDENKKDKFGPELHKLLAAMTAKSANDIVNLERLEIFGDSFLKYICSYFLFRQYPDSNEGVLTSIKGKLISNRNLLYCGQAKNLHHLIQAQEFIANGDWVPPKFRLPGTALRQIKEKHLNPTCMHSFYLTFDEQLGGYLNPRTANEIQSILNETETITDMALLNRSLSYLEQKALSDKGIADSVEALIGVYITNCGLHVGPKLLMWLGVFPKSGDWVVKPDDLLSSQCPTAKLTGVSDRDILQTLKNIQYHNLESLLKYSFKDKSFLLQALTHSSYAVSRHTDCYQRLEFLGDAVLDFLVTSYIYQEGPWLDPGQITNLRSALVNNVTFGSLCVKYGIHRYLLSFSSQLSGAIEYFCDHQRSQNFAVNEAVLLLLEEKDVSISKSIEVPKALGDLFESLAGAIYLDSGNSLNTVWDVFYPLMKNELHDFIKHIPRNPMALLYELGAKLSMITAAVDESTIRARIDIVLHNENEIVVYGFGVNKYEAKRSAGKIALRRYMESKEC